MTTETLSPVLKQRFFDNNGNPLFNGQLTSYAAGTTTPLATYKDSVGTLNTNPIILNARGECDCWIPPNIAYKFLLQDSLGNTIPGFPIDNVVNSQLITLYGGVDTGSANAYILNFTANFTAYSDGIVIYWVPAHTNTGPSTINVNGLGVINITNPDGSALVANEIVANFVATILIKGGVAQLISSTNVIYSSFTCTWGGFSAAPANTTINYRKNGNLVTLVFPTGTGTSNATTFSLSGLPAILTPAVTFNGLLPIVGFVDNGANVAGGAAVVSNAGNITFYKDGTQGNWTASGNKGFSLASMLTYSL